MSIVLQTLVIFSTLQTFNSIKTCHDIAVAPKTSFYCDYVVVEVNYTSCHVNNIKPFLSFPSLIINILEEVPCTSNATVATFCLGLKLFNKYIIPDFDGEYTVLQTVGFDPQQAVGTLVVGRKCWQKTGSCDGHLELLDEVLALGIFNFYPLESSFWNFTSHLFGVAQKWLLELSVHVPQDETIGFDWLSRLSNTSLEVLIIENNYLGRVGIPLDIPSLTSLYLKNNDFISFYEDSFVGKPSLLKLDLSGNVLQGLPHLLNVPLLQTLDISNNFRADPFRVRTDDLATLTNLRSLSLSHNNLYSINGMLPLLPKLEQLYLSHCQIQILVDDAFQMQPSVATLDLSGNLLQELSPATFASLLQLEWLDLSSNQFAAWPPLHHMRLQFLNLASNKITELYNLGHNGTTVQCLNISNNDIYHWEDEKVFTINISHFTSLRVDQPDRKSVQWTGSLGSLCGQLASNSIFTISKQKVSRSTLAWARGVILSYNNITVVTRTMGLSIDVLDSVDLGGNPFDCGNCDLPSFQSWIRGTNCQILNLGMETPLQCYSPVKKVGLSVTNVTLDNEACLPKTNWLWLPLGIVLTTVILSVGVLSRYRLQISYMIHLYSIRRRAKVHSEYHNNRCYDAFVCYSGQDRTWVLQRLAPFLENGPERYRLCLHDRDFLLGSRIVDNIVDSIEKSRKAIIVLSENFIESTWCQWELEMANHKMFDDDQHFLVLIQLERIGRDKLPRHLKFLMDTRTYLEWPKDLREHNVKQVCRRLRAALGASIHQMTSERAPLLNHGVEL